MEGIYFKTEGTFPRVELPKWMKEPEESDLEF